MRTTAALLVLLIVGLSTAALAEEVKPIDTDRGKISYSVGVDAGRNFRSQGIEVDEELFIKGFKDGLHAEKPLLSDKEIRKVLNGFQAEIRQKLARNRKDAIEANAIRENTFLKANMNKPGVVSLPSGLQYIVLTPGDPNGPKPQDIQSVECRYRGTLIDGTEFDSTDDGKTDLLHVGGLVPGWREGMKLMTPGSKYKFFIPSKLAWGTKGVGKVIAPNDTVIMEVELIGIK